MEELKPCPFCGSDDRASHRDGMRNWIECHNCHATGPTRIMKEGASAAWNERKLIAAAPDLLAACEDALDFLDHAPFSMANGVEYMGIDEGEVRGRRILIELSDKLRAAITKAQDKTSCDGCAAYQVKQEKWIRT